MCAPVSVVPAGKPVTWTVKSYVAPVMLLAASRVIVIVICIVPLADASALVTAGTSLPGNRMAVNRATFGFAEGVVGESLQEIPNARTKASIARRFMCLLQSKDTHECNGRTSESVRNLLSET